MFRKIQAIFGLIIILFFVGFFMRDFIEDRKTLTFDIEDQFTVSALGKWKEYSGDGEDTSLSLMTRTEDMKVEFVIFSKEEVEANSLEEFSQLLSSWVNEDSEDEYFLEETSLESYPQAFDYTGTELINGEVLFYHEYMIENSDYYIFISGISGVNDSAKMEREVEKMISSIQPKFVEEMEY